MCFPITHQLAAPTTTRKCSNCHPDGSSWCCCLRGRTLPNHSSATITTRKQRVFAALLRLLQLRCAICVIEYQHKKSSFLLCALRSSSCQKKRPLVNNHHHHRRLHIIRCFDHRKAVTRLPMPIAVVSFAAVHNRKA